MIITYPAQIELNLMTGEFTGWFPNFVNMGDDARSRACAKDIKFVLTCLKSFIWGAIEYSKQDGLPMPTPVTPLGDHRLDGDIFTFWQNISIRDNDQ